VSFRGWTDLFFFFLLVLVFSDLAQYDRLVQMVHTQPKLAELFGH
jgi:hypothetical protein